MNPGEARHSWYLLVSDGPGPGCLQEAEPGVRRRDGVSALECLAHQSFELVVWDLAVPGLPDPSFRRRLCDEGRVGNWLMLGGEGIEPLPGQDAFGSPGEVFELPGQERSLGARVARGRKNWEEGETGRSLRARLDTLEECRVLSQCLEAGKVYPVALDLVLEVTGRQTGIAIFRRPQVPGSYSSVVRGLAEESSERLQQMLLDGKRPDLDAYRQTEIVDRGDLVAAFHATDCHDGPLLVVPLRGREGECGLLCVPVEDRSMGEDELGCIELVADRASTALNIAENYELAKERAFIDDVTQVYNARYLLSAVDSEIRRAERYDTDLSLLFLDLDRFKRVNDRNGHLVGTEALRRLVGVLKENVREVDTLARYGGDEFTILLGGSSHRDALQIAERIRSGVEGHVFEIGPGDRLELTLSIGVASFPEHGASRESLLEASDKAMYRAKSLGRNRVCSAGDLEG